MSSVPQSSASRGDDHTVGDQPAVWGRGLSKSYPGARALRGVDLDVGVGEVRGLVGANGSGKSTLVKLLAGAVVPDRGGQVELFGQPLAFGKPQSAQRMGVSVVYQELTVFAHRTVLENVFAGQLRRAAGFVDNGAMRTRYRELCQELEVDLAPDVLGGRLSVADQTMVEIMRAIVRDVRILILDEPTAALAPPDRERLYRLIDRLKQHRKVSIIYISHDLDEVMRLVDSISVFRAGQCVGSGPVSQWTKASMIEGMLGEIGGTRTGQAMAAAAAGRADREIPRPQGGSPEPMVDGARDAEHVEAPVLALRNVQLRPGSTPLNLAVKRGEIVGIAGLMGAGRTRLLMGIAGAHRLAGGELLMHGVPQRWPRTVGEALKLGVALAPEDRKGEGLALGRPVWENVACSDWGRLSRGGVVVRSRARARADELLGGLAFRRSLDTSTRTLSGGNQQKVLLAKWLHRSPEVLLLDEPTRGIDVGAKAEIFETMRALAQSGLSIIFVSSEFDEIVGIADRVVLLGRAGFAGELSGAEITMENMLGGLFQQHHTAPASGQDAGEVTVNEAPGRHTR